jgi:hypothetical protein
MSLRRLPHTSSRVNGTPYDDDEEPPVDPTEWYGVSDGDLELAPPPVKEDTDYSESQSAFDARPKITIGTDEHRVNAAAVEALAADESIYQRGGVLVRIVRDASPATKGIRRPMSPRIEALPAPVLRERLTAVAAWKSVRETNDGATESPAHPPAWCVSAVYARGEWPGIRHLEAVVDYPVLRPDGTILSATGYDPSTGLFLAAGCNFDYLPSHPSHADAVTARNRLLEVIADFPFEHDVHKAAWLAGVLTPLARFAFVGPAPLFLVDSNVRGAGKGLLLDCNARIITGERFTIATYTDDENELRKRITSLAMSGERLVLFDNLDGRFGNAVLDAALTGTSWTDRILGINRMTKAPLYMTWFATGNNVAIAADTARRVCHVRLESDRERPEQRQDFKHADLLGYVGDHRPELLAAALTILRGYYCAGRPDMELSAWGSFEGWSRLVCSAVAWVGLPDPGETRIQLQDHADTAAESMGLLLDCWEQLDRERRGMTGSEVCERIRSASDHDEVVDECRAAIESLVGKLDSRLLGNAIRKYRRRIFDGRYFDRAGTSRRAVRWAVFPASEFGRRLETTHKTHLTHPENADLGESCESGESISTDGPYRDGF